MIDEGDTPKLITSRLEVIKTMHGISSMKPPITYFNCLMLIIRLKSRAEYNEMINMFQQGGFVFTIIAMLLQTLLQIHCTRVVFRLADVVRKIAKDDKLELDYSEVFYYLMIYKLKCRRHWAALLRIVIDIVILTRRLTAVIDTLTFSVTELCRICNRYGNDFNQGVFIWIAFIPLCILGLLGNYKAVALLCFTANSAVLFVYAVLLHDFVYGVTFHNRRMVPQNTSGVIGCFGATFRANVFTISAPTFMNEMDLEENFLRKGGVLNVGTAILMVLHLVIPGLGYLKYGDHFITIASKTSNFYDMVNLLIVLAQFLTCSLHLYIPFHIYFPFIFRTFRPKHVVRLEVCVKILWVLVCAIFSYLVGDVSAGPRQFFAAVNPLPTYFVPALFEILSISKIGVLRKIFNWFLMILSLCHSSLYILRRIGAIT